MKLTKAGPGQRQGSGGREVTWLTCGTPPALSRTSQPSSSESFSCGWGRPNCPRLLSPKLRPPQMLG